MFYTTVTQKYIGRQLYFTVLPLDWRNRYKTFCARIVRLQVKFYEGIILSRITCEIIS